MAIGIVPRLVEVSRSRLGAVGGSVEIPVGSVESGLVPVRPAVVVAGGSLVLQRAK